MHFIIELSLILNRSEKPTFVLPSHIIYSMHDTCSAQGNNTTVPRYTLRVKTNLV